MLPESAGPPFARFVSSPFPGTNIPGGSAPAFRYMRTRSALGSYIGVSEAKARCRTPAISIS